MPNPACIAYEAYRKSKHEHGTTEVYLLSWNQLSKEEHDHWWAVIRALTEMKGPPLDKDEEYES